jgi:ABC-type uncharacterized transport system ATPase subunit
VTEFAVEMRHITKQFPLVLANDDVTFTVKTAKFTPWSAKTAPANPP